MKTIKIIFPFSNEDTNKGVKVANDDEKDVYGIFLPRSTLSSINHLEKTGILESKMLQHIVTAGVYILIGEQDNESLSIYIGSSENCLSRVNKHHNESKKEFENIIIFVSSKNNYNGSYGKYLESKLYKLAKKTGRCNLLNAQTPSLSSFKENEKAKLKNDLKEIKILAEIFGLNIFKERKVTKESNLSNVDSRDKEIVEQYKNQEKELLYCSSKYAQARGYFIDKKLIILKESRARVGEVKSFRLHKVKKDLIDKKVLEQKGNHYIFTMDYEFNSPSTASSIVLGIASNGKEYWKDREGNSLKDIEDRQIKAGRQDYDVHFNVNKATAGKNKEEIKTKDKDQERELLYCSSKYADARGYFIDKKLIVLEGSRVRREEAESFRLHKVKKDLADKEVLEQKGEYYIFTKDYEFSSPSTASSIVLGIPSNGRNDWKNKEGKSLKEITKIEL